MQAPLLALLFGKSLLGCCVTSLSKCMHTVNPNNVFNTNLMHLVLPKYEGTIVIVVPTELAVPYFLNYYL